MSKNRVFADKPGMRGSRPLEDREVTDCLGALGHSTFPARNRALFVLGVRAGFRISEILSLKVEDVYQAGRMVDRVTVARKNMKKKQRGRTVILHQEAKILIEVWVKELEGLGHTDGPLFRSREGSSRPITRGTAHRILVAAYKSAGVTGKLGTHAMRKTFAKRVYEKLGHDLIRTQRALDHSDIKSTMSYLSFNESDIDDAILKD